MLYLNPPYDVINGVSVFSDHEDPLQFYYLPLMPRLTALADPTSGARIPQIQLIKYRGSAGNGGFLNFDCNIGVDQAVLDDIAAQLKSSRRLTSTPRLGPVPLIDGTVRLLLLGAQTPVAPPPGTPVSAPPVQQFVTKIDQAAKPALYGDNQATFSVSLDAAGIVVLEAALNGDMSPIGIVYSLDFLALRPAYSVRLSVDWDRVQHHLDDSFSASVLCFSTDIEKVVDELVEKRFIVIEADTFVPEGEDTTGVLARRDQALNEVRDMITDAFFTPTINPYTKEKDGWDKAAQLANTVSMMAVTGGMSSVAAFSYKHVDVTRIDKKTLNVNISERTTVRKTIYPQGHLSGFGRTLQNMHVTPDSFTINVNTDDPWFAKRRVKVISRADFTQDDVQSLNVQLRYGNSPQNVILDSATTTADVEWPSNVTGGAMALPVFWKYKVSFTNTDAGERPQSLDSPETPIDVEKLEIQPRDLYSIVHVPIVGFGVPWDRYPRIEVAVRYIDAAHNLNCTKTFVLDKDHTTLEWRLFVLDQSKTSFDYQVIYRAADNKDIVQPWTTCVTENIDVRDPFPGKRVLEIVATGPWSQVQNVFVDLSYDDPQHQFHTDGSVSFSETDQVPKSFSVDLHDPSLRRIGFKATILYKDGREIDVPQSYTLDRRIIVRSDMRGHRVVTIRSEAIPFATKKITRIVVDLRYVDAASALSFSNSATLSAADQVGTFEFDYVDETKPQFEYKITYFYTNGMTRENDWQQASSDDLQIPVV